MNTVGPQIIISLFSETMYLLFIIIIIIISSLGKEKTIEAH